MPAMVKKTIYVPYYVVSPEDAPDPCAPDPSGGQGRGEGCGPEKRFWDEEEARAWLEEHRAVLPGGRGTFRVVRRWLARPRLVPFEEHVRDELGLIGRRYVLLGVRHTAAEVRVRAVRPEDGQPLLWLIRPDRTFLIGPCRPEGERTPDRPADKGELPLGSPSRGASMTVRPMTPADALLLLLDTPLQGGMTTREWETIRKRHDLHALIAVEEEMLAGFVLAQSHPALVHILQLRGQVDACRLLLEHLVRVADGRALSTWCPAARTDLCVLLEQSGFAPWSPGVRNRFFSHLGAVAVPSGIDRDPLPSTPRFHGSLGCYPGWFLNG